MYGFRIPIYTTCEVQQPPSSEITQVSSRSVILLRHLAEGNTKLLGGDKASIQFSQDRKAQINKTLLQISLPKTKIQKSQEEMVSVKGINKTKMLVFNL